MLPLIDLDIYRSQPLDSPAVVAECNKAAEALITYGALLLQDSRVSEDDNATFLDLLEDYFSQPLPDLQRTSVRRSVIKSGSPSRTQRNPSVRSTSPVSEPKCRFFWRMGDMPPYETQFPALNMSNVVPQAEGLKDRWAPIMEKWGSSMKSAVEGVAQMAAVGLGLPQDTFRDAGRYGPHLLAPTASDLVKYNKKDTILAGFHTDLNFLTIHGRSRYPGLHIWARNTGKRILVQFPPTGRYLLVQAGKQLEHLSGGLIKAGYHEVVVNEPTIATIQRRKMEFPDRPLIRISSTFFWHLSSDYDLAPIPSLAKRSGEAKGQNIGQGSSIDDLEDTVYEPMKVGQQVQSELKHIELMA
ncbi:hypothetical protein BJV77DRAFT_1063118 [Russula vinacea]|nr:hypothetical protein BJV77DRAFT_1063118 [Russula vinacea]